jgi:hypothetical protein
MKDILAKVYNNSFHKLKAVHKIDGLVNWIDKNCNKELMNSDIPQQNLLHFKIYSIFHPLEEIKCKNGKWLHYSLEYKKPICVRSCSCWKHKLEKPHVEKTYKSKIDIEQKKRETNLRKYGFENPMQCSQFSEKQKRSYAALSEEAKQEIINKRKNTSMLIYGVENPAQSVIVKKKTRETLNKVYNINFPWEIPYAKEKSIQTNLKLYGVTHASKTKNFQEKRKNTMLLRYGQTTASRLHIPIDIWAIINNEIEFKNLFIKYGCEGMAIKLGVSRTLISTMHKKYNLNLMGNRTSSAELEISSWLSSLNVNFEQHNRIKIRPHELDFYLPDDNLAIEYNGLYWHSEELKNDKNYHFDKTAQCEKQGIQLLHIFEDEWIQHKDICKSIILSYLNKNSKIMARKCNIQQINGTDAKIFLNENHLQGYTASSVNLALYYNKELVSIMTFKKARYNKKIDWELIRLANKKYISVVGGMNKLWKYFLMTYQPNSVVSYCDKRWFSGKIYKILGFTAKSVIKPTYWYTDYEKRFHRSKFTKKNAIKHAKAEFDEGYLKSLTEKIIVHDIIGMKRIWDCGQQTWIWKNKLNK